MSKELGPFCKSILTYCQQGYSGVTAYPDLYHLTTYLLARDLNPKPSDQQKS